VLEKKIGENCPRGEGGGRAVVNAISVPDSTETEYKGRSVVLSERNCLDTSEISDERADKETTEGGR